MTFFSLFSIGCWLNIDKLPSTTVLKTDEKTTTDDDNERCLEEKIVESYVEHPSDSTITNEFIKKSIQYSTVNETVKYSEHDLTDCETYEYPAPNTTRKSKPNVESKLRLHRHYRKDNKDSDYQFQCVPLTAVKNS